ncbi:hypothetical protein [Deinococcus aetherius]|uniref:hypothetical protein n=1 Tax=Deinococcus aetherius TaxID=200252 RepID=UPI002232BFE5|nr:hypothetical protein [Deinococcus aetherius]
MTLASPNLKLSREMKVLLVLLLLVALIGGGYVWLSARHAQSQALAQTPSGPGGDPASGAADGQEAAPDAGLRVQPDGQVEVPSIPAFGADSDANAARPKAEAAPPPGGINPDTPLAALPPGNPFRPLELAAGTATGAAPSPVAAAPVTAPPVSVTRTALPATPFTAPEPLPSVAARADDPVPTPAEPVVIPPLPSTNAPVKVASAPVSGKAFPVPGTPPAGVVTLTAPSGGREPVPAAPVPPAPPVRPPVAGVRVPGGALDLNALLGPRSSASGGATGAAGTGTASATALPTPELPQPITQLGGDRVDAAPVSPLDDLVRRRELAFDAGVLGPVNTAIFRSKGGFLVVSVGQPLPDSDVVVKDVSASGATLALGTETKFLELDKR